MNNTDNASSAEETIWVQQLQTKITEGTESGIAKDFDPDVFEERMLEKHVGR